MTTNIHIPKEADVMSFNLGSIVFVSAEYVECLACFCVVKYSICFFCTVIGTGKLDLDVEILFVAAAVILFLILGRLSNFNTRKVITRFIMKQCLSRFWQLKYMLFFALKQYYCIVNCKNV